MSDAIQVEVPVHEKHEKHAPLGEHIDEENLKAAHGDAALAYAAAHAIDIDAATNKRLVGLTDRYVLPWLCALYFMQYLDKGM
jgi:hypothetical protein